jgi:Peptidase family S41
MTLLLLLACTPDPKDSDLPDSPAETAPTYAGSATWCNRVAPAAPVSENTILSLSAAHATIRLFGPEADMLSADAALVATLEAEGPWDSVESLRPYAEGLPETCVVEAIGAPIGEGTVELKEGLAWVQPGTQPLSLPPGATGVVVDLRGLPESPESSAAVQAAISLALAAPVPRALRNVRLWEGFEDQVFSSNNVYSSSVKNHQPPEIPATGSTELPLAFVVGDRVAPSAATLAAELRLAGRAVLVGQDLPVLLAESRWLPVGGAGLLHPIEILQMDSDAAPLKLPADLATDDAEAALADGIPSEITALSPESRNFERRSHFDESYAEEASPGTGRAALLSAHGTLRRFFPYFSVGGEQLDDTLLSLMSEPPPGTTWGQALQVARLGATLHDGHCFWGLESGAREEGFAGYAGLVFEFPHPEDAPIIAESAVEGLQAGDEIQSIGGVPVADLRAAIAPYWHAATDGYTADLIGRQLHWLHGPTEIVALAPDGTEHRGTATPLSGTDYNAQLSQFARHPLHPNGPIAGAESIHYIDLDQDSVGSESQLINLVEAAQSAEGVILDARGYPAVFGATVAEHFSSDAEFYSAQFRVPAWLGPEQATTDESQYRRHPEDPVYTGPLVILTGPVTVSAGEDILLYLLGTSRELTILGRQTAGTNGNITGMDLPGGLYLTFTGMELLWPDGSPFHGSGILPDIEVVPTAEDLAAGRDTELEAAIALLQGR